MLNSISNVNNDNISKFNGKTNDSIKSDTFSKVIDDSVKSNTDKKDLELKKACEHFESYFLNMMFKSMRKTVISQEGLFNKSNAQDIFEDMFYEETSKKMAKQGGIGLANMMYKQLSHKNQSIDKNA